MNERLALQSAVPLCGGATCWAGHVPLYGASPGPLALASAFPLTHPEDAPYLQQFRRVTFCRAGEGKAVLACRAKGR